MLKGLLLNILVFSLRGASASYDLYINRFEEFLVRLTDWFEVG
jgi:hypothetical protein